MPEEGFGGRHAGMAVQTLARRKKSRGLAELVPVHSIGCSRLL